MEQTQVRFIFFSVIGLTLASMVSCSSNATPDAATDTATTDRVAIQLNWFAEAEHGGVYSAYIHGYYADENLDVEIRPGGLLSTIAPELDLGRVEFAIVNAEDVVLYRQQQSTVVAVLAAAQIHPRCLIVRADSDIQTFEDLGGNTLHCQLGRPYLAFLEHEGLLDKVQLVPYQNSIAPLASSRDVALQGYIFAEPLSAEQAGIEVRSLLVAERGFNPYSSVLVTTEQMIAEHPDVVQRMVDATRKGWQRYLESPKETNQAILKANEHGITIEALDFGVAKLQELCLPEGMESSELGTMTAARWQTLVDQMIEIGLVDAENVTADACYTTKFIR